MINIKEEVQIILLKNGLSMRKMLKKMRECGIEAPDPSSLSKMFSSKSIRFDRVQQILDFLGYELVIKRKGSRLP